MLLLFAFLYLTQLCVVLASTPSYFYVTAPTLNASWTNNGLNVVKWVSAKEGIAKVDMQLVRLSVDGVLPIAQAIPTSWGGLNIVLQDTPEGNDYFILLLDSGGSTIYSLSQRFSISKGASPASNGLPSPVPTATVSGAPNPTMQFAATYGASSASRLSVSRALGVGVGVLCALWGVA